MAPAPAHTSIFRPACRSTELGKLAVVQVDGALVELVVGRGRLRLPRGDARIELQAIPHIRIVAQSNRAERAVQRPGRPALVRPGFASPATARQDILAVSGSP